MPKSVSARLLLFALSCFVLLPAMAQASTSYEVLALKNDKTLNGRPNRIQYQANDFYSVYYVYMNVIRALAVEQHLSSVQVRKATNRIIGLLKQGKAAQLTVPGYPGDGVLRVTVRTGDTKSGSPILLIVSNYDPRSGKTLGEKEQSNAYGTFFYLIKDKLVKYQYITNAREKLEHARQSTNNMADFYLLNEKRDDDASGKRLLIAGLGKNPGNMDRFIMQLTLMEYYLLENNTREAKASLDAAGKILATERDKNMRLNMKNILPYGEDVYSCFMSYKHSR
jgi:hypothetical protein